MHAAACTCIDVYSESHQKLGSTTSVFERRVERALAVRRTLLGCVVAVAVAGVLAHAGTGADLALEPSRDGLRRAKMKRPQICASPAFTVRGDVWHNLTSDDWTSP